MTNEEKLLIATCQSYFNESELIIPEGIDYKAFYNIAKNHNLIGIAHCVFNKNKKSPIPDGARRIFEDRFFDLVYIYEMQKNALNELSEIFEENEIRFALFKGAVIRNMYSVAEARSMGDIDLLIDSKDVERVKDVLGANGFVLASFNSSVYTFEKNGVEFEVHTRLIDELGEDIYKNALDSAKFDGCRGVLEDNLHLAYLVHHTANHLKTTGAGARFVLDIAYMLKCAQIDLNKVFELLEVSHLTNFGKILFTVCNEWFGYGQKYVQSTDKVQEYLLKDGVFGSRKNSTDKTVARLIQLGAVDNKDEDSPSALKLKLQLAFPSYSSLRRAEYITFLDGKPYLLPAAWMYRLGYNLKHSRKKMINNIKNIDDENVTTLAKEELEFFEEIGLI